MRRCASVLAGGVPAILLLLSLLSGASAVAGEGEPVLNCDPPCVHGECVAYLGNLSCQCIGNWSGEDCSNFICNENNKCQNGGTCSPDPNDLSKFLCSCPLPYFGNICQYTTAEVHGPNSCEAGDPCNGSTCYNLGREEGGHQCFCRPGWWGVGCNYTVCNGSNCPQLEDRCQYPNICHGRGTCIWNQTIPYYFSRCHCEPGWKYSRNCELVNGPQICRNNGACGDYGDCSYVLPGGYDPEDDDIIPIDYHCTCDGTHQGRNCSEPFDICDPNPCVSGTCNATHGGHYFKCVCPPGRRGPRCENYDNPCDSHACLNGGNCTTDVPPDPDGSYRSPGVGCSCCTGFSGDHCEIASDNHTLCRPSPCLNGGQCHLTSERTYKCECTAGFTGDNCQLTDLCTPGRSPCHAYNTEKCFVVPDEETERGVCFCREGWGGDTCTEDIDECLGSSTPLCLNGGSCVNTPGGHTCICPPEFTGPECRVYVQQPVNCRSDDKMCKHGGTCVDQGPGTMVCNCTDGFTGDLCESVACQYDDCPDLATNGQCDMKCFTEECGFDGGERYCLPTDSSDPWQNCSSASVCRQKWENGECDRECNTRECLFDSHECIPAIPECPADLKGRCVNQTGNGVCDKECNTAQCPYDSEDCNSRNYLKDRLVVYILGSAGQSFSQDKEAQRLFQEAVGAITNTNPVIESIDLLSTEEGQREKIVVPAGQNLYRVTLKLDTEYCSDVCIKSILEAVAFLNAYYASGKDIAGFSYVKSEAESETPPASEPPKTTTSVAITVTILVVALLGLFVVAGVIVRKRKVIRAKIFYPGQSQVDDSTHDRSPPSKRRKVAQNDLASGTLVSSTEESSMTASCTSGDYIREGSKPAKMEGSGKITWTDYKVTVGDSPGHDPSDVAVVSQVGKDSRKWNYLHYSAVRNPEVMRELLEKCRREDSKKCDVNTPGPGGYTPLMLAVTQKTPDGFPLPSRSSSSSDSSGEHSERNGLLLFSPNAKNTQLVPHSDTSSPSSSSFPGSPFNCSVDVLLSARVRLDATNDYGRTALHLAAVCARGDYVKKLLAAGANPNVQDNWGQSALHAAIGAAAEGAFQMLLDFPKTDINLKSDGGTTPLMDAVKTTNMYMVKQLVKKNADISIADYEGRTAVHWAAMTENVEALKLLIRQGPDTIKDTQDNKGQTALFLACREGATECARHLLDVFANATLLDNLDRSPMTIAFERQHGYIMEMLKSHGPYHYQLPANGRHAHSVPHHVQMVQHHEMALRQQQMPPHPQQQQQQQQQAYASYSHHHPTTSHPGMMVEMQQMPPALEHYPGPEMQLPPRGQTFGDVGYPVSSSMDLGLPGSASYKQMNTPLFFSNTMPQATESVGAHTPTAAAQAHFYPPSTSSQLPVTSAEHPSPPSTYHQHSSPPTQLQAQPTTSSDLQASYSQPHPAPCGVPPTSYPAYPTSTGHHFVVTNTTSDSEQRMVSELITSISDSSPHQQLHSPPQQPHSASSVHSNRSPSALYPSPPNSDSLQHSSEVAQQNGLTMVPYASPPSLTPSPEGRDEAAQQNITTIEGLVQQHEYPSVLYGGADSYNYGGIRFAQDYSTETTV